MSTQEISDWISATAASQAISNTEWVIPTVQSIHILAIAVLVGSALVLDLKLAGFIARTESATVVFRRYMPWLWWGLAILVLTGTVMVVGEPERVMQNWIFWTKMALVLIAFFVTLIMRVPMLRADLSVEPGVWTLMVKPLGVLALAVWVLIILCGRWIAYAI